MTAVDLLSYRVAALRRRVGGAGSLAGPATLGLALAAAGLVAVWVDALVATDLAGVTDATRQRVVLDRLFWLNALQVLVFAYTTFEVIFRARDTRFVALLPLSGATRWWDLMARAFLVHLPLLVPVGAYGVGLVRLGESALGLHVLAVGMGTFVVGIPLCAWGHLMAGRSMLGETTAAKRMMAGQVVPDDAALLLYAPALGLAGTLVVGLMLDFFLRRSTLDPVAGIRWPTVIAVVAVCLVVSGKLLVVAAGEARRSLHRVVPRFLEVDVAPPYREDGLPESTPGAGLVRLLPAGWRPTFLRDLVQLRRRHRLDRILLWVLAFACLRRGWAGGPPHELMAATLTWLSAFVVFGCHGAFALRGQELAAPWLDRSLPMDGGATLGAVAASAIYPLCALGWAVAGTWLGAGPGVALTVAAVGIGIVAACLWTSWALAVRTDTERMSVAVGAWWALSVTAFILVRGGIP